MIKDLSLGDRLLAVMLALLVLGLVMVYSSSAVFAAGRYQDDAFFFLRQLKFALLGLAGFFLVARLPIERLRPHMKWLIVAGALVLVLVLVPGIGKVSGGARRWLPLGFALVQPAELAKLLVIVFMANVLARRDEAAAARPDAAEDKSSLWAAAGFVQVLVFLVLLERDFGTAVMLEIIVSTMLFVGGVKLGPLLVAGITALPVAGYLIYSEPYRWRRIVGFMNPFADRRGAGYQLSEALISMGSGGASGLGLGDGRQKLYFLPEAHTDFIFAIVGEELGFLGCGLLIALFGMYLWLGQRIGRRAATPFQRYVALGTAFWLVLQAGVNMCVATGLLPTKGLTLPFISYGGSSLIVCCLATGLVYAVARGAEDA